jgi:hypothetical protein
MAGTIRKRSWVTRKGEPKTAWTANYKDQAGSWRLKTFPTKKAADAWLHGVRAAGRGAPVLLSLDEIRKTPSLVCGIYFLFLEDRLVRIGQSADVAQRIKVHRREKRIPFDNCHVVHCLPAQLDVLEALYIAKFKPPYNRELSLRRSRAIIAEAAE